MHTAKTMLLALLPLAAGQVATEPPAPLDLRCVATAWSAASVTYLYPFSGGESGTYISDGGQDMYDDGNELRLRVGGQWSEPLKRIASTGLTVRSPDATLHAAHRRQPATAPQPATQPATK